MAKLIVSEPQRRYLSFRKGDQGIADADIMYVISNSADRRRFRGKEPFQDGNWLNELPDSYHLLFLNVNKCYFL